MIEQSLSTVLMYESCEQHGYDFGSSMIDENGNFIYDMSFCAECGKGYKLDHNARIAYEYIIIGSPAWNDQVMELKDELLALPYNGVGTGQNKTRFQRLQASCLLALSDLWEKVCSYTCNTQTH